MVDTSADILTVDLGNSVSTVTPATPVTPVTNSNGSTAEPLEDKETLTQLLELVKETRDELKTLKAENAELKKFNMKLALETTGKPKQQAEDIIADMFGLGKQGK
jgi:hypothetical protein